MPIRFKRIKIEHLLGIDNCEYEPGTLTIFEGENGTGKSSQLRALWSLLGGKAKQPTVMNGYESGRITVEFDNGFSLEKMFFADKPPRLVVRDQRDKPIGAPQDFVDRIIRAISMNPIRFAADDTPAKERLEMLLSVAPIRLSRDELMTIVGTGYDLSKWFGNGLHIFNGLPAIDALRKRIYETDRRDVNRDLDQKEKHIAELRAALPKERPVDHSERLQGAKNDLFTIMSTRQEKMRQAHDLRDQELTKLRQEEATETAKLHERFEAQREQVRQDAEKALATALEDLVLQQGKKNVEIAQLEEQSAAFHRAEQTLATIERYERDATGIKAKSEAFSGMLVKLDELRKSKLADLPIPVQIQGDEILVEVEDRGLVPIEDVNTAKRLGLGLQLAVSAAGECGAICIDGIERLDWKHMKTFEAAALAYGEERGLQFFATRVIDSGDLQIRTIQAGVAEPASLFAEQPEPAAATDPNDQRNKRARKR